MIGLGRMGGNIVRRLMRHGHTSVVYDANPDSVAQLAQEGATPSHDLASLVAQLQAPRALGRVPEREEEPARRGTAGSRWQRRAHGVDLE